MLYFFDNPFEREYCNHEYMAGIKKRLVELGDSAEATDVVFIFRELTDVLGLFHSTYVICRESSVR